MPDRRRQAIPPRGSEKIRTCDPWLLRLQSPFPRGVERSHVNGFIEIEIVAPCLFDFDFDGDFDLG
jgi:hypothetical protein